MFLRAQGIQRNHTVFAGLFTKTDGQCLRLWLNSGEQLTALTDYTHRVAFVIADLRAKWQRTTIGQRGTHEYRFTLTGFKVQLDHCA